MGFELNEAELPSAVWLKFDSISNHGASQIDIVSSQSPEVWKTYNHCRHFANNIVSVVAERRVTLCTVSAI